METDAQSVAVRPLEPADLGRLVEMMAAHAAYEQARFDPTGKAEAVGRLFFADPPAGWCLVAMVDGTVCGYASASLEMSTWNASHYLHMDTLFVDESARSAGVGAELLDAIAALAVHLGVGQVQWQTPDWNDGAIRFYNRYGATASTKQRFTLDL